MQFEPVQRSIVQNQSLLLSIIIAADVMCFIARSIIAHSNMQLDHENNDWLQNRRVFCATKNRL